MYLSIAIGLKLNHILFQSLNFSFSYFSIPSFRFFIHLSSPSIVLFHFFPTFASLMVQKLWAISMYIWNRSLQEAILMVQKFVGGNFDVQLAVLYYSWLLINCSSLNQGDGVPVFISLLAISLLIREIAIMSQNEQTHPATLPAKRLYKYRLNLAFISIA